MTKNRLIEMMGTILAMKSELERFPDSYTEHPTVKSKQHTSINVMKNHIHFLEVVIQSELENASAKIQK